MNKKEREVNGFIIRKGIPVPKQTRVRKSKYPWASMEIDECVDIPIKDRKPQSVRAAVVASINLYRKKPGNEKTKFTLRYNNEDNLIQVWRTE